MNPAALPQSILAAFLLAAVSCLFPMAAQQGVAGPWVYHWMVGSLACAWVILVLRDAGWRSGSLALLIGATSCSAIGLFLVPDFAVFAGLNALLVAAVRCASRYEGGSSALLDVVLTCAGFLLAAIAAQRTGSVFVATWSFFLVQAMCACIPVRLSRLHTAPVDPFDQALHRAREAVGRISRRPQPERSQS